QDFLEVQSQKRVENGHTAVDRIPIDRLRLVQLCSHAGILAALATEQKCNGALTAFMEGRCDWCLLGSTQQLDRLRAIPRHEHPAVRKTLPPHLQGPCDIGQSEAVVRFETI